MSRKGETYPNLRSRKPKMVPYVHSHDSPVLIDDDIDSVTRINHAKDIRYGSEKSGQSSSERKATNGEVIAGSLIEIDDSGGGGRDLETEAGDLGLGRIAQKSYLNDRDLSETAETSFIENGTDTQPLLESSESGDDGIDIEIVRTEDTGESSLQICLQVSLPYIIAGFGMVLAGIVLDIVQHWPVFVNVSEIFVLVPALLGLKGNLEMTLASRLSTQAHLGNMDKKSEKWKMIGGNMALIQAQAIVVGFLASMVAMVMGWIPEGKFNLHHALLLCASSMCTAAVASFVLGSIMVGVVLLSRKCNINPDNVATPIAASLGDLTTLALLSGVACLLYKSIDTQPWIAPVMVTLFILLTPLWIYISLHNHYTNHVVYYGWVPVLSAMFISSVGGLILDFTVANYHGIAVFQPVINGVGGNLVAVQASRISTSLHRVSRPGKLPSNAVQGCPNCPSAFFGKNINARATRVLLGLVIPGHLIFMYTISFMKAGHTSITPIFSVMYLTAAVLQVAVLLYVANWIVHLIWRKGDDPDNVAIPYLTALGDLLGTAFLAIAFHILFLIGDKDADIL
ncbi:solute carrier family 41 member 1-like isoform X2 [Mercenaria mercenaria]|uniref:solute carrier family 41 member 1-like isoform X2 n=1 Tax=Mercenaria mercenaria TaxID=6596 RepID=UPI00234F8D3C|nr:solute carrier family 41 member 1-like isoform X2 [Mercenaria mercenaria]